MMKIKKISLSILSSITVLFSLLPMLVQAYPSTPNDPLQYYNDQIKKAQKEALDKLEASIAATEQPPPISQTSPSSPVDAQKKVPPSNTDKAFVTSPPPTTHNNESEATASASSKAANPWAKPNPWAEQGQPNPWANAPIPEPISPSTTSRGFTPPPNIFAPPNASNLKNSNPNHR
jgi:hypothetical protein